MVVYADPTPRWVPFVVAGLMTAGGWWGGYWATTPPNATVANTMSCVLLVLRLGGIVLQGARTGRRRSTPSRSPPAARSS